MPPALLTLDRGNLVKVLVTAMFVVIAIDMGGDFGLRNTVVPVCALLLLALSGPVLPRKCLAPFLLLVAYPTAMLVLGLMSGAERTVAMSQYQSTVLAFVLYVLVFHIPYQVTTTALLYSLFAAAMLAVALAVGLLLGADLASEALSLMADKQGGYFGEMSVGTEGIVPNVYFKSTLFFVPAFVMALRARRHVIAAFCFMGLVAAVSKTGMAVTILIAGFYLARYGNWKGLLIGGLLLSAVIVWLAQSPLFALFYDIAQGESGTVDVRIGHFESLVALWRGRPANLFFGFGLGSTFYSSGAGDVVSNIEIDHFNVVRKYGLIWAAAFFLWVLEVAHAAIRDSRADVRALGWGLLVAFIVAGTNPVLLSSLFFLFLFVTMAAIDQAAVNRRLESISP